MGPLYVFDSKGKFMSICNTPSVSRRSALRRMLGLAATTPLVVSELASTSSVRGDWFAAHTMRIEEDWYVQIGTPSPVEDSPQITTVLSPSWTLNGNYAVFDMNCATQPNFESGGVQLQLWEDNAITQSCSNVNWDSLCHANEEIRYTSAMSIENDHLVFEILNGTSSTWGTFGHGELKLQIPTWRNHLNWYSPWFSESNSRIGFASHRVKRFILERVRFYSSSGMLGEQTDSRILHYYNPV